MAASYRHMDRKTDIEELARSVELSINSLPAPARTLDRAGWETAIKEAMPWLLPQDIRDVAGVMLLQYAG